MDLFHFYPKMQRDIWVLVLENAFSKMADKLRSFQFLDINKTQYFSHCHLEHSYGMMFVQLLVLQTWKGF